MPQSSYYRSQFFYRHAEIEQICERARQAYSKYRVFQSQTCQHAYLHPGEGLPELGAVKGIRFGSINAMGLLSLKKEPFSDFRQILTQGASIARMGRLILHVGFEEKNSKQTKRGYDVISILIERGKQSWGYSANGSLVSNDPHYCAGFFRRLVEIIQLPLSIREDEQGVHITHTIPGCEYRGGQQPIYPSGFFCDLPDDSVDQLVSRMEIALQEFASTKRFVYQWDVLPDLTGRLFQPIPESLELYHMVAAAGFPAERHEVHVDFFMDTIEGVDALQPLCGAKDVIFSHICSFNIDKDRWANLEVETTMQGHRIRLETRLPVDTREIKATLGAAFSAEAK
ncbi:MAG: hypothetical protein ACYC6A_26120 [Armatimonadota bacterium]